MRKKNKNCVKAETKTYKVQKPENRYTETVYQIAKNCYSYVIYHKTS